MPPPGGLNHEWVLVVTVAVEPDDIAAVYAGGDLMLDELCVLTVTGPGCLVCEQVYEAAKNTPCPGPPGT